jgi:hypothetical protein
MVQRAARARRLVRPGRRELDGSEGQGRLIGIFQGVNCWIVVGSIPFLELANWTTVAFPTISHVANQNHVVIFIPKVLNNFFFLYILVFFLTKKKRKKSLPKGIKKAIERKLTVEGFLGWVDGWVDG